jgi:TolB-like protein
MGGYFALASATKAPRVVSHILRSMTANLLLISISHSPNWCCHNRTAAERVLIVASWSIKQFFHELRRRKVLRVTVVYGVVGWAVTEIASVILPLLLLPDWTVRLVLILILLGFPLAIILTWAFDITPTGIEKTKDLAELDADLADSRTTKQSVVGSKGPPSIDQEVASVAVLPFDDLSPSGDQTVLANGIATEIHCTLNQMHRIRVAPRRSSFKLAGSDAAIEAIAEALDVRYILSGSLMRHDNSIRVIAEVDDAIEGSQIWSRSYERDFDDLLAVQAEIAEEIVATFGGERQRAEIRRAQTIPTDNLDAWNLVQRARHYILDYGQRSLDEAESLLLKGIELDPDYAAAHAALGSVLAEQILNGYSDDPEGDRNTAIEAVRRARALAAHDAFVLKMSGMAWAICGNPEQSVRSLRASVELAPFDFGAWGYLGWPLVARGSVEDLDEVHNVIGRLLKLAPQHAGVPYWLFHKSVAYVCQDDLEQAARFGRQSLNKNGELSWVWMHHANLQGLMGQYEDAERSADKAAQINSAMTPEHYVARVRAMGGSEGTTHRRIDGLAAANLVNTG